MRSLSLGALLISAALFLATDARAQSGNPAPAMQPGFWEITIQMVEPSVVPASTSTVCISPTEAHPEPPKMGRNGDCRVLTLPAQANEVAYTVRCDKSKRSTTARFTYYGDHYEGYAIDKAYAVDVRITYSGKRIGECDAAQSQSSNGEAQ